MSVCDDLRTATFVNKEGFEVSCESLLDAGKNIGIYFSAHWCPPCRGFTPKLVETYTKLQKANAPFEIIFVSSDSDEDSFKQYYGDMPWLALPYSDRERKESIATYYGVSGIPMLVILSPQLKVINNNARSAVTSDPDGKSFPWGSGGGAGGAGGCCVIT
ncbi:hypothetical protein CYMTET_18124 [Cymbomonas tetramitiformis]|uniref:Thioredoxin domain-containing protein n=1 Tax=Cymbomonas tetramitiformis TaxID=36881 RepID=A0AAE0L684_9CHLO|nr:hypothetical protein CYMTET_18124 [Cymbomonas tetramitiformis]